MTFSPIRVPTRLAALFALCLAVSAPCQAQDAPPASPVLAASPAPAPTLNLKAGKIVLQDGLADLNLPEDFRYLDKGDARKVLVDLWGNPPTAADDQLGMIVPASFDPEGKGSWGVIVSYDDRGYVKDDEARSMDYGKLLQQMKDGAKESNKKRVEAGYDPVEIIGWAAPPRFDAASKKMYWAKQLRFGGDAEHDTLNYDVRILGRRGVLVLQAVSGMEQLDQILNATPKILSMVNYNEGHRYADFNPKTDKVATYGLTALVLGGIAAKAGFFKVLIAGLIAAKKLVIVGVVAVAGFVKKLFGGQKEN